MAVKRIKLANVVIDPAGFLSHAYGLAFRPEGKSWGKFDALHECLVMSGTVDFSTYFNMLPVAKWRSYCEVRNARLHLELAGDGCQVDIVSYKVMNGLALPYTVCSKKVEASEDYCPVEVDVTFGDAEAVAFRITSSGVCRLKGSYYYALVDDHRLNPVRLAVGMVTYDKDLASIPNLHALAEGVFRREEPVAGHMQVLLVDQVSDEGPVGRRKSVDAMVDELNLPDDAVQVLRSRVLGTSGFVARAMLEATRDDANFTHLLLVGRNYKIHPETVNRVFVMLSLLAPEHALSTIVGGTFRLSKPTQQMGDVFHLSPRSGTQRSMKPPLNLANLNDTIVNESVDVDVDGAFAPWRLACIPVPAIRDQGFPLPLFIHCDDVEYGMRAHPRCLAMSGIGCWDVDRNSRLGEEINCYQFVRNMLIANAVHNGFSEELFMVRYWRNFRIFLRYLDYASAELWLDGLEDYLKGPRYLIKASGKAIFERSAHKDVQLVPVSELSSRLAQKLEANPDWLQDCESPSAVRRLVESLPHDPHVLPDFVFRRNLGVVGIHGNATPWHRTAFCKKLVALEESGTMGYLRVMDRDRYRQLRRRGEELKVEFANSNAATARWYQDLFRKMSSRAFWERVFDD